MIRWRFQVDSSMALRGLALICTWGLAFGCMESSVDRREVSDQDKIPTIQMPGGGLPAADPPSATAPPTDVNSIPNEVDVTVFAAAFNLYRTQHRLSQVRIDAGLTYEAQKNNQLQQRQGIGHHHMGSGVMAQNSGENYFDTQQMLQGWHESPGHQRNMQMSLPCFGIHKLGKYWTLNMGRCR